MKSLIWAIPYFCNVEKCKCIIFLLQYYYTMKQLFLLLLFLLASLSMNFSAWAQSPRQRISLNDDWCFKKGHPDPTKDLNFGRALSFSKVAFLQESTLLDGDQKSTLTVPHTQRYDDSQWQRITIPHDWGMEADYAKNQFKVKGYRKLGGRTPENCIGWYRKTFHCEVTEGHRYLLEFEGIFRDAQIWMNGIFLGRHISGYTPVVFDVTECLNYGKQTENVITVRVDATHAELWSYEGAGIYRNVWLTQTSPVYIPQWGIYVTTQPDARGATAQVKVAIEVRNELECEAEVELRQFITDNQGRRVTSHSRKATVNALQQVILNTAMQLTQPRLWSLDDPHLYHLHSQVWMNGAGGTAGQWKEHGQTKGGKIRYSHLEGEVRARKNKT